MSFLNGRMLPSAQAATGRQIPGENAAPGWPRWGAGMRDEREKMGKFLAAFNTRHSDIDCPCTLHD